MMLIDRTEIEEKRGESTDWLLERLADPAVDESLRLSYGHVLAGLAHPRALPFFQRRFMLDSSGTLTWRIDVLARINTPEADAALRKMAAADDFSASGARDIRQAFVKRDLQRGFELLARPENASQLLTPWFRAQSRTDMALDSMAQLNHETDSYDYELPQSVEVLQALDNAGFGSDHQLFLDIVEQTRVDNDYVGIEAAMIALRSGSEAAITAFKSAVTASVPTRVSPNYVPASTWINAARGLRGSMPKDLLPAVARGLETVEVADLSVKLISLIVEHDYKAALPQIADRLRYSVNADVIEAAFGAAADLGDQDFDDELVDILRTDFGPAGHLLLLRDDPSNPKLVENFKQSLVTSNVADDLSSFMRAAKAVAVSWQGKFVADEVRELLADAVLENADVAKPGAVDEWSRRENTDMAIAVLDQPAGVEYLTKRFLDPDPTHYGPYRRGAALALAATGYPKHLETIVGALCTSTMDEIRNNACSALKVWPGRISGQHLQALQTAIFDESIPGMAHYLCQTLAEREDPQINKFLADIVIKGSQAAQASVLSAANQYGNVFATPVISVDHSPGISR